MEQHVEIDTKDQHGRTAFFYAVQQQESTIAKLLLQGGTDPNTTECGYAVPILYSSGSPQTFQDLEFCNNTGAIGDQTPLFFAAGNGDDDMVNFLLEKGVDPNHQDRFGERPICWAAGRGCEAVVKMLLDSGADLNQLSLFWALGTHRASIYDKIKRGGLDVPWLDGDMQAVVSLLLQHGADPNITNEKGQTPLSLVVKRGFNSNELVTQLLKAGSNPNIKDEYGRTLLMGATVRGMDQVVIALLEAPNIVRDASDTFGRIVLIEATRRREYRLSKL